MWACNTTSKVNLNYRTQRTQAQFTQFTQHTLPIRFNVIAGKDLFCGKLFSTKEKKEKLWGSWSLKMCDYKSANNVDINNYGNNAKGLLIYTKQGEMSVQIMSEKHSAGFAEQKDRWTRSTAEKARCFDEYLSYFGTYQLFDDHLVHNVVGSLFPEYIGTHQKRFYTMSVDENGDDLLILSTPPLTGDYSSFVAVLTWKKIKPNTPI